MQTRVEKKVHEGKQKLSLLGLWRNESHAYAAVDDSDVEW